MKVNLIVIHVCKQPVIGHRTNVIVKHLKILIHAVLEIESDTVDVIMT